MANTTEEPANPDKSSKNEKESSKKEKKSSKNEKESSKKEKESSKNEKESSKNEKESSKNEKESSKNEKESSKNEKESSKNEKESSKNEKESSKSEKESSKSEKESSKSERESKDDQDIEFYFFYDIVKKSLLKRKEAGDICALSSWLRALEEHSEKETRLDYIKLMVLSLQYLEPMCPFKDPPPDTIDPLDDGVIETMKLYLSKEGDALCEELEPGDTNPSISTAVSSDKCQYASYQVIPNVGVQCYYAYSDDNLYHWSLPQDVSVPKNGPHAKDIEWERSFAGIVTETVPPASTENLQSENDKSASTAGLSKKRLEKKDGEDTEICNVMYIEQQNRNVTEEFTWNDASLLTGVMILGAEMCSDRKVDAQVKTQVEIDEEIGHAHDKLYPGDFKICVNPSIVGDLITPKKHFDVDGCNININCKYKEINCDNELTSPEKDNQPTLPTPTPSPENGALEQNSTCSRPTVKIQCEDKVSNFDSTRQSAGHGNIRIPDNLRASMMRKKDGQKHKLQEIGNSKYFRSRKHVESKSPITAVDSSSDTISHYKIPLSKFNHKQDQSKEINLLFERASLELQRSVSNTSECFDEMRTLIRDKRKEPKKLDQNTRTVHCDSDEPSDA